MSSYFFNLDNSSFSKIAIYLIQNKDILQSISDIATFSGVEYKKAKYIIARMYKFGMIKQRNKSGHKKYVINFNNGITKKFNTYYKTVIKLQMGRKEDD